MFADLPESVDVWRMVTARRIFEGQVGLEAMPRLVTCLADAEGTCTFRIDFDRNEQGQALLDLTAESRLPLVCQRTLERFELPVVIHQQLGLIRAEHEEAALPPGVEPLLVPATGVMRLLDVVEDELILAVPVVPMSETGLLAGTRAWPAAGASADEVVESVNPFSVLASLRDKN